MIKISGLDHLVLTVSDLQASCVFYRSILGMEVVTFAEGRKALRFGMQKINLHEAGHEYMPHAYRPVPGSADLCLLTGTSMEGVMRHLADCGVVMTEGPVERTGGAGPLLSVYFRDPDGNLLEISNAI
jgi:catechol 2,3-dioxygenase-like lactoylglutathione lyase family enzyme